MDEQEERFEDGNVSGTVRVGNTVRRETGPWTMAVHTLLQHLEQAGFDGAPRVMGLDARGREILTFIEGATIPASMAGYRDESVLVQVANLLRRYHDATATFCPPPGAVWRHLLSAPKSQEVICHNDIGPYNTVVVGLRPVAFIDWDFAAPGTRIWDIAHALWRFAPLYADDEFGSPTERSLRMACFCDAYGLKDGDRRELLDTIERRMLSSYETFKAWAVQGIPAFVAMWQDNQGRGTLSDMIYLRKHRAELVGHLGG